jgi:beta-glucosidase
MQRYKEDFALARELGLTCLRTTLEWALFEPRQGSWRTEAVHFYRQYLREANEAGLRPLVGLHHFTNPRWFTRRGGWLKEGNERYFRSYVRRALEFLADLCDEVLLFNEPNIYPVMAYFAGILPPYWRLYVSGVVRVLRLLEELLPQLADHAHAAGLKAGITLAVSPVKPAEPLSPLSVSLSYLFDRLVQRSFARSVCREMDFVGIDYYVDLLLGASGIEYAINPNGLYEAIRLISRMLRKPVLVTETGIFTRNERLRAEFLRASLAGLRRALEEGFDVRGFLWWSLLHGYEWGLGYEPFIALIDVDFQGSFRRIVTPLASLYGEAIRQRGRLDGGYDLLKQASKIRLREWRYDLLYFGLPEAG